MSNIEGFTILNIRDYLQNDSDIGEADLRQLLSDFSCPLNPDVERFLKEQDYMKKKWKNTLTEDKYFSKNNF